MALAVAMLKRWRKQSETMERLQKKKEEVDSSVENGAPEFAVINLRSGQSTPTLFSVAARHYGKELEVFG